MSGQSLTDRITAAQHSVTGSAVSKTVCKATTHEVMGPKKKHLDYLIQCTNEMNVNIPQLADSLFERTTNSSWVVVFKSLITTHHLMVYGNEFVILESKVSGLNAGDLLDPERLIQCPFVKQHQIRACRFPYHLVKCKESNPEIAKKLATCPFNARHLVPRGDLSDHIMKCNDQALMEQDVVSGCCEPPQEQGKDGSTWQAPPCDEDWETEVSEMSKSAFVWGIPSSAINSTISDQTNSLPSRLRAPETLPYAVSCRANSEY